MIPIIIFGAGGRMGGRLLRLARQHKTLEFIGAIESAMDPRLGQDAAEIHGLPPLGIPLRSDLAAVLRPGAVVIDFSKSEPSVHALQVCVEHGAVSFLSGTTGFSPAQMQLLRAAGTRIPVLHSPNMSLGINLLLQLLPAIRALLPPDFEIEILEAHHRHKADAPSGTALKLAEALGATPETLCYGRQGKSDERPREQIGIHALRLGEIIGEHQIRFCSAEEELLIEHRVHSRDVFARGALTAAEWLAHAAPGFHTFLEVLQATAGDGFLRPNR